ncbi:MAG: DNA-binding response OmpR family regulator [Candidatus Paceibacteria bacterium]|jgi:DNA-binding response OmpR family regulator
MELSGKTILLVEDDQLVGEMLNRRLRLAGAKIIWASDGEDALEKIVLEKIDVIVTDLMMPRLDGFEMLKQIKANPKTMNIPFMMLTNRSVEEDEVNNMKKVGLDDYVVKSEIDLKGVVAKIVSILEKKGK